MSDTESELVARLQDLDSLWNPKDLAASKATFKALMLEVEKLATLDRSYLIELQSLIGRAETFEGNFPQARLALETAGRFLKQQNSTYRLSARLRWMIESGRLHIFEKTPSQARQLFAEAWTLATGSGEDSLAVETAQLLATVEPQKTQQEWIQRGIQIAESSQHPRCKRWLGSLYASMGWKLYDLRQFEKALETFRTSLKHLKAHGTEREAFVAQWSTGKVLRALGRTEEALATQKELLAQLGIGGDRDGRLYEEIAECLQTLRRAPEAHLYFELAYRELSQEDWVKDNQPLKLKRMKDLGKVKDHSK